MLLRMCAQQPVGIQEFLVTPSVKCNATGPIRKVSPMGRRLTVVEQDEDAVYTLVTILPSSRCSSVPPAAVNAGVPHLPVSRWNLAEE